MRLILESTGGPACGKRLVVRNGETLSFGRTDTSDYSFPDDNAMSRQHFQIAGTADGYYLSDLGSTNGTGFRGSKLVPGQPAPLVDGDTFVAGGSQFCVRIEAEIGDRAGIAVAAPAAVPSPIAAAPPAGVPSTSAPSILAAAGAPPGGPAAAKVPSIRDTVPLSSRYELWRMLQFEKVHFTAEECKSGLAVCRGKVESLAPADLAVRLAPTNPATLIVDFRRLGSPPPAELAAPNYVMNWLDPAAAAAISPVVTGPTEVLDWAQLIEEGWGQDAVVCLFSKSAPTDVLQHIRLCCRGKEAGYALAGYCWPRMLEAILANSREMAGPFMEGIEAVLIEAAGSPDVWQLFGKPGVAALLEDLGLTRDLPQGAALI